MLRDTIEALKYLRHTNIVQLQGYSDDEESELNMVVYKGRACFYQLTLFHSGRSLILLRITPVRRLFGQHWFAKG